MKMITAIFINKKLSTKHRDPQGPYLFLGLVLLEIETVFTFCPDKDKLRDCLCPTQGPLSTSTPSNIEHRHQHCRHYPRLAPPATAPFTLSTPSTASPSNTSTADTLHAQLYRHSPRLAPAPPAPAPPTLSTPSATSTSTADTLQTTTPTNYYQARSSCYL